MHVEDHPVAYGSFEGTIPKGQYGGGTVMLWDRGAWEPIGDPRKGYKDGRLKFILHGEKLQGGWMLVRKGGRKSAPGERAWFLFKERDGFARPGESVTEQLPLSVATGRDLDEIAANSERVWGPSGEVVHNGRKKTKNAHLTVAGRRSKRGAATASKDAIGKKGRATDTKRRALGSKKTAKDRSRLQELLEHPAAKRARLPQSPKVELATLVDEAPSGTDWLHEIKFDGYRMLCRVDRGKARFISRNGHDWTAKFPELAEAASRLSMEQ